ncbi:MAG TPA: DUF4430 domain-containing protein [Gaiellaceae bacterium]
MSVRRVGILLAAALLAGCGGEAGSRGTARLWITRDRGAHVLLTTTVPAGLTAMQALDREADIETRYGGRFVQSIDGLGGSLASEHDWFWFVNGYEGDRSAAEYRLRPGDVEWWDYRSWRGAMSVPVVVGAFPEPFLHGYDGKRRPALVVYSDPAQVSAARRLARLVRGSATRRVPDDRSANVLLLRRGGRLSFTVRADGNTAGGRVTFVLSGDPARLPAAARFRYSLP